VGAPAPKQAVDRCKQGASVTLYSTTLGWYLAHRQQAVGGDTLIRHDAKQLAGRQAGVVHEHLEIKSPGKPFTRLPRADGGHGNAQVLGDRLECDLVLLPPVAERDREAGARVAVELMLLGHGETLSARRADVKADLRIRFNSPRVGPEAGCRRTPAFW